MVAGIAVGLLVALAAGHAAFAQEMPAPAEPAAEAPRFYLFSPDWRPADIGKLTVAIEAALASGGLPVSFQGFTRYEDFEGQVAAKAPSFIIAPAWYGDPLRSPAAADLTVVARPERRGRTSYRKALMTGSNIDSIDDLAKGSVAATLYSMGPGSAAIVLDSFRLAADSTRVVPVPKDVDALLALSFGQVDAALVTSAQYELFARANAREAERLCVLAFSAEVNLPPVFATASGKEKSGQLRDLLLRIRELSDGPAVLEMLGFDGFVSGEAATKPESGKEATAATAKPEAQKAPGATAPKPGSRKAPAPASPTSQRAPAPAASTPATGKTSPPASTKAPAKGAR